MAWAGSHEFHRFHIAFQVGNDEGTSRAADRTQLERLDAGQDGTHKLLSKDHASLKLSKEQLHGETSGQLEQKCNGYYQRSQAFGLGSCFTGQRCADGPY